MTYRVPPSRFGEFFTWNDYRELAAYYAVDPWCDQRGDLRIAQLTSVVTQMFSKKGLPPSKFMPFLLTPRPTPAQLLAKMKAWARMHNARERGN